MASWAGIGARMRRIVKPECISITKVKKVLMNKIHGLDKSIFKIYDIRYEKRTEIAFEIDVRKSKILSKKIKE